ncbi:MAG: non-canonical purine NTP pyrophosphatase, partial [Acidimicrobiales bacterium]
VPEVQETGGTLVENARLKAVALCEATGLPAIADDTGLEVDALGGAPGVFTARFAGEGASYADNVAKLLEELAKIPLSSHAGGAAAGGTTPGEATGHPRSARFRTVAICRFPDGTEVVAQGVVEGEIAEEPRGKSGFGYDPIFVLAGGGGRSFAEMPAAQKNAVSHRGLAFRALAAELARLRPAHAGQNGHRERPGSR